MVSPSESIKSFSPGQLAEIAYQSSLMHKLILNENAKIAFLSFDSGKMILTFEGLFNF